ncbi:TPA: redox-regulated ATPase YchF [bacterium]|nr:redox-regulated ATPase YchF [bacterium]
MHCYGIVGLPNVGKSTLFNALTHSSVLAEKYPFSTTDHHIGVVKVPDERLKRLAELVEAIEVKPTTIEFVDIAGLVKGAHKGEGLGNRFLSYIREVDCIVEVVRLFRDETISHISTDLEPISDIETINLELIFKDLETISKRRDKLCQLLRTSKEKRYQEEWELLGQAEACLNEGRLASSLRLLPSEGGYLKELSLLTAKPFLYVANIDEEDLGKGNQLLKEIEGMAKETGARVVNLSAKLEDELKDLPKEEADEFRQEMGMVSGINALIAESYSLLDLISFFTVEHRKVSSWTLKRGMSAQEAAGKIHSDMEKGFISAEVVPFYQLIEVGSLSSASKKGLIRQEGREYVVQDGDVITFRFNV